MADLDAGRVRRFAFVSYDFSTRIAGGSLRAIGFVRHVHAFGWEPYVITASPPDEHPAIPTAEVRFVRSPERQMDGGIKVSAPSGLLEAPKGLLQRLAPLKKLLPLERQLAWLPPLRRALADDPVPEVDAVVTTIAPYCILFAGRRLAKTLGVPHVVDLRDDWFDRIRIEKRSWTNRTLLDSYATKSLREASAVLVVSPVTQERLASIGIASHLVYNGFEEEDFVGVPLTAPAAESEGPITILHSGWLGSFRSVEPVLKAMEQIAIRSQSDGPLFRFRQMGLVDESELSVLSRTYRGVEIEILGQRSHDEAKKAMLSADVLLAVPGTDIPAAVSGKLFEYLRSRRAILLIARQGAARQVGADFGLRFVADPHDPAGIESIVATILEEKVAGTLRTAADSDVLPRYTRRHSAQQLARVLDDVTQPADIQK